MERRLTAILSADVKGYSRLMGEDEEATIRTLTAYREVMATLIRQHRGRVVDSPGDNLLAEFASVVDAVQCAVVIQTTLKAENANLPPHRKMEFRIGINLGDVMVEGERIYGDGVNIAARVEGLAEPGGICISGIVYDQVKNKLALGYEYLGEQSVKNIAEPVRVYRVQMEGKKEEGSAVEQKGAASSAPTWYWQKGTLVVVGLLLLGTVGVVIRNLYFRPSSPPLAVVSSEKAPALPLPDKPSIAVLPFANMSEDPEQEYFSDGMAEDLMTDLYKISGLFVISRHSAFTYKGKAVKVEEVGRELGVRYVLEGSVRKADDRVLITAQLVDALTGHHVWAERYDRPLKDIFALQEEVRRKIVVHLAVKLTDMEAERLEYVYTSNPEAYDYFLRGWKYLWRSTQEENAQARQMFERATELDPTYAVAYAWQGFTYAWEWGNQWSQNPQVLERAFELEQQALALDDSVPLAHDVLAQVYLWRNKQYEQAIAEAERAIAISPNFYSPYAMLGLILNLVGRPAEAIEAEEKAMRLNPRNPVYLANYLTVLGESYRLLGRYEEAITAQKRALAHYPNWPFAHLCLAIIYGELGREEEAQAEVAEVLRVSPNFSLEGVRQILPFKDPAEVERVVVALRKAGLE